MDLSLVFPVWNRAALFKRTLESLLQQEDLAATAVEVVVIDDGSTDDLLPLLKSIAVHGLPVRYRKLDVVGRYQPPEGTLYCLEGVGAKNPAVAVNVGIQTATGARVVLSSPEILWQRPQNLRRFVTWDLQPKQALIADVWDEQLKMYISGGSGKRPLHFLACFHREDLLQIGGFEEAFMAGCGFEDTEFIERWRRSGREYVFSGPAITAFHQAHPRFEMGVDAPAREAYMANERRFHQYMAEPGRAAANVGRAWGDPGVIVEQLDFGFDEQCHDD